MADWSWLSTLPPAVWLQQSGIAYLFVNAAHIGAIGLLAGCIVALDLCLLGVFRNAPVGELAPFLSRVAAIGLGLAAASGAWLFSVDPEKYLGNPAFLAKLVLIAAGVLNALWLHHRAQWRVVRTGVVAPSVKLHAAVSVLVWPAAIVAGRWIGFI